MKWKQTSVFAGRSVIATIWRMGSADDTPLPLTDAGRGKTMATFGSQLWLISAASGETATPIDVREGVCNVKEFTVN